MFNALEASRSDTDAVKGLSFRQRHSVKDKVIPVKILVRNLYYLVFRIMRTTQMIIP